MSNDTPGAKSARIYTAIGLIALVGALSTKLFFIGDGPDAEQAHGAMNSLAIAGAGLCVVYFLKLRKLRRENGS